MKKCVPTVIRVLAKALSESANQVLATVVGMRPVMAPPNDQATCPKNSNASWGTCSNVGKALKKKQYKELLMRSKIFIESNIVGK